MLSRSVDSEWTLQTMGQASPQSKRRGRARFTSSLWMVLTLRLALDPVSAFNPSVPSKLFTASAEPHLASLAKCDGNVCRAVTGSMNDELPGRSGIYEAKGFSGSLNATVADPAVGGALLQAGARGPAGLDAKAKAAYALVNAAASAGVQKFSEEGDFSALRQVAGDCRKELVDHVAQELRSGRADIDSVAEYLVDSALARAARCMQGGKNIYEELWILDEGRASVASVREKSPQDVVSGQARISSASSKDILIDEQDTHSSSLRPLFHRVSPYILSRVTALAILGLFEIFAKRGGRAGEYTDDEKNSINHFLHAVDRTPVMRRCRAEAEKLEGQTWTDTEWYQKLWKIWFQQPDNGRGCGFEHVFAGEATEDLYGREIVGGLHNWIKFYLEERRGAAKYLGHRYPGRLTGKDGLENPRFVSGRFTWDMEGRHLVKDVGGFFVGVSPEWQFATATTAFFETESMERAVSREWSQDSTTFDKGFVRTVKYGPHIYRLVLRRSQEARLTTFFVAQLGTWDRHARAGLDETLSTPELLQQLPSILVLHGFADESRLLECAARIGAAGAFTLREALQHLRAELSFKFEAAVANCSDDVNHVLADGFHEIASGLVDAYGTGSLTAAQLPNIISDFERQGFPRHDLYRPLRLGLTGQRRGHDLQELLQLLELLDAGAPWSSELVPLSVRMATLERWLKQPHQKGLSTQEA